MKVSVLAMFSAFAIVLSYVESFIPVAGIPGVKLGIANLAIILVMYFLGTKAAGLVNVVRIVVVGFMFGNLFSILFSIAGALFSIGAMAVVKKTDKFKLQTVSVAGGVAHNIGQLIVAVFVVDNYSVIYYVPALIISGIVTGIVVGIVADIIYNRTKSIINKYLGIC